MASRLEQMDALVKELSCQDDPDHFIRVFARRSDLLFPCDGMITLTRRDLEPPLYRITRSWRWRETFDPWLEPHRLPVFDRGLLGELLDAGKPRVIPHLEVAPDDPAREHFEGMQSLACAPGYERGETISLVVALCRRADVFTPADLETLLVNANLLSRAVNNLRLARQLQEAYGKLDAEMEEVARLQRHFLPATLPRIDGLEIAVSYVTSSRAGGDYYNVLPLPEGRWGLFLADVSGHGTPAAVVTAMLHTLLSTYPGPPLPPAAVLAHLNRHLLALAPEGMFVTAFYGIYDPATRVLRYANAGHPPPHLRRRHDVLVSVGGTPGLPLGVLSTEQWREAEIRLLPGEALLLYTDGLLEGTNERGEPFGEQRLDDAMRLAPLRAAPLVAHVERLYRDFCNGRADQDDRTLLAAVAVP
jgi:phosphoserine phosphatase RsbU/P